MGMNLEATRWTDKASRTFIEMIGDRFVVRDFYGRALDKQSGKFIYGPIPSERDDDYIARCRFDCWMDAARALDRYLDSA